MKPSLTLTHPVTESGTEEGGAKTGPGVSVIKSHLCMCRTASRAVERGLLLESDRWGGRGELLQSPVHLPDLNIPGLRCTAARPLQACWSWLDSIGSDGPSVKVKVVCEGERGGWTRSGKSWVSTPSTLNGRMADWRWTGKMTGGMVILHHTVMLIACVWLFFPTCTLLRPPGSNLLDALPDETDAGDHRSRSS